MTMLEAGFWVLVGLALGVGALDWGAQEVTGILVDFQDNASGLHKGHEEFTTLFTSVDQEQRPELRYDPADPTRFVLSWGRDVTGGRLLAAVFFLAMGPVFLLGAFVDARGHLRGSVPRTPPVAPGAAS